MDEPDVSLTEWKYLSRVLSEQIRTLPKTGTFQPYYNATSWDTDDLYRCARQDAVASRSVVESLIADRKIQGSWPRGRYPAKFWLRARWGEASLWAESLAKHASDQIEKRPNDIRRVVAWLVYDLWDSELVDLWLAEHLGDYTSIETYGTSEEDDVEFSKWLDRLRSGQYFRPR